MPPEELIGKVVWQVFLEAGAIPLLRAAEAGDGEPLKTVRIAKDR
jgi:hypothetical protein